MFRILALVAYLVTAVADSNKCDVITLPKIYTQNSCVSFTVGPGTGCAWMCTYCAGALGTNDYYFTDGVCTYQPYSAEAEQESSFPALARASLSAGCVGNPQAGVTYTCCAV